MAITISYEDGRGEAIPKREKFCEIIYKVDDVVKKIEHVEWDSVIRVTYYLSDNESIPYILDNCGFEYVTIVKTTRVEKYKIEELITYDKKELYFIKKILTDQFGSWICRQEYDINATQPILIETDKYYSDPDDNDKTLLEFGYDHDGLIDDVGGELIRKIEDGNLSGLDKFLKYFPNFLLDHPYYADANFLPH